jgi:hypothetical protein
MLPKTTKDGLNITPLLDYNEIVFKLKSLGYDGEDIVDTIKTIPGENILAIDIEQLEEEREILNEMLDQNDFSYQKQFAIVSILTFLFDQLDEEVILIYTGD